MFKLIRLILRIAVLMFILLLVLAFFTNPGIDEFKEEVTNQLNSKVNEETDNPSLGYIAELGKEFTDQIVDKLVTRKNYFVCSIYTVQLPDGDYHFLGAFHTFYPLQDKNPLESLGNNPVW